MSLYSSTPNEYIHVEFSIMNFAKATIIIKESYKNPETLEAANNFLDAITLLQNMWKKNKLNKPYKCCKYCKTLLIDIINGDDQPPKSCIIRNIVKCNDCGCVLWWECYCHD